MIKTVVPCGDRVLIEPIEMEARHGSILIADLGEEKPKIGKVVAVGPGRTTEFGTRVEVNVQVGDIVMIPKIGSFRVDVNGNEHWMCPDKEILGKITLAE